MLAGGGGTLNNSGAILGGAGGSGGSTTGDPGPAGGAGGAGGAGVVLEGVGTLNNTGLIAGGRGGAGGSGYNPGSPGALGNGANLRAGGTIDNSGTIEGGDGVYLAGGQILNSGTIKGGESGFFSERGNGVVMSASGGIVNLGTIEAGMAYGYGYSAPPDEGIAMSAGGTLTNGSAVDRSAIVEGGVALDVSGDVAATVINYGTLASVFGDGVMLSAGGRVLNSGAILGGTGMYFESSRAFDGGAGGGGMVLQGVGTLTNTGAVTAGRGGAGLNASLYQYLQSYYPAGAGGKGGDGVDLLAGGGITNSGFIEANAGGAGGNGYPNGYYSNGANGGAGGAGVVIQGSGTLINNGAIGAAVGGIGGYGTVGKIPGRQFLNDGLGGTGGDGGSGVILHGAGTISNAGIATGADGGDGGAGGTATNNYLAGDGGAGGKGGDGVDLLAGGLITNSLTILAGAGGSGGAGGAAYYTGPRNAYPTYLGGLGGSGGAGGAGAALVAGTLSNGGLIAGGDGAAGGVGGNGGNLDGDGGRARGDGGNGGAGGNGGDGVDLLAGGKITNSGTILAGAGGLGGAGGAGYYGGPNGMAGENGAAGNGVLLTAGGVLTNGSTVSGSALISGGIGVYAQGAGATVTSYGTIEGVADSVKFASAGDVLIASEGAQFVGQIIGGGGTLGWRGGGGTISGLGGSGTFAGTDNGAFSGFGTYLIGATGAWALSGTNALNAGQSLTDHGALLVDGSLTEAAGATITITSGAALAFTGSGSVLAGTISGAGTVAFAGGADTLSGTTLAAVHMAIGGAGVTLLGTIANSGTVAVTSPALLIGSGGVTLAGGTWALSDNAANTVRGVTSDDTLNNATATISGAGMLGGGVMTLINRSAATIDGNGRYSLIIDTGANRIANAGLIEAVGAGGVTIQSAVLNAGKLEANGGTLTVNGAVSGPGTGVIASGALVFISSFTENVTFSGISGILQLAQSQAYAGTITGFSTTGGTSLDLRDVGFVSSGEATFSGSATSGVLTVTDGTHTAHINLAGDYRASTFVAASDGHGGVIVHDPTPAHRFIAAAASLGAAGGGAASVAHETWRAPSAMLAKPGVMVA